MSKDPKHVFEVAATVGLGSRGFTSKAMALILRGVKESIEEAIKSIKLQENDLLIITGSLYLAGEFLRLNETKT